MTVSPEREERIDRLNRFHVVLVEPAESLNVGAVARAMRNLGFRHLHLVAPIRYDRDRAQITACWAESVLDSLIIHERFEDAISDMEEVVGLSMRSGKNSARFVTLPEWTAALPARPLQKTALVFGPEDNGLRQEHLNHCRWTIRIPSMEESPSFNLAQSVLLVLYGLTQTFPEAAALAPSPASQPAEDLPTWNDFFQLDRLLDSVMERSGFLRRGTPAPVPGQVKNLFRRLSLNRQEMGVLLGLFGKISTVLQRREESSRS